MQIPTRFLSLCTQSEFDTYRYQLFLATYKGSLEAEEMTFQLPTEKLFYAMAIFHVISKKGCCFVLHSYAAVFTHCASTFK